MITLPHHRLPVITISIVVLLAAAFRLPAQQIKLRNLTVSDSSSKVLYLGIDNKFWLSDFIDGIEESPNSISYVLHEDTLTLVPRSEGSLKISIKTMNGLKEIFFAARPLPLLFFLLGEDSSQSLAATFLQQHRKITISTKDPFYDGYLVESAEATINANTFLLPGNLLSNDLLAAINKATTGDELLFHHIVIYNASANNRLLMPHNLSYQLK